MLTDTSLALITFINLFLIPLISLRIYYKRSSLEATFNFELVFRYALYCILNLLFARITCSLLEKTIGLVCLADSSKYTLIALITASILPFIVEIIEHFIKVDVTINYKEKNKNKEKNKP